MIDLWFLHICRQPRTRLCVVSDGIVCGSAGLISAPYKTRFLYLHLPIEPVLFVIFPKVQVHWLDTCGMTLVLFLYNARRSLATSCDLGPNSFMCFTTSRVKDWHPTKRSIKITKKCPHLCMILRNVKDDLSCETSVRRCFSLSRRYCRCYSSDKLTKGKDLNCHGTLPLFFYVMQL